MAASATKEQVKVTLRLVVDEKKNKVVFAHAGKDFVDALLSFLTLPLGTIARLVSKKSNIEKVSVGSLSSMYESLANMEVNHFLRVMCKEMLLQPRNSMETYCKNMKLNIDDTEKMKYFICENWECSRKESGGLLSTFRNTICKCGKLMNREISHKNGMIGLKGFIPEMLSFIIHDDLRVMPDHFLGSALLGIGDFNAMKEVTVNVTNSMMVDLLKCSLLSKTPLTDIFMRKKLLYENYQLMSTLNFNIGEPEADVHGEMMKLKVMIRKSNRKVLFALAEEDFVDFLCSFFTFPMGGVEHMLKGNSGLSSIDNLYKSMVDLDDYRYLKSPEIKEKLVKSQIAHQFKLQKLILSIDEVPLANYSCCSYMCNNKIDVAGYLTVLQGYSRDKGTVYAPLSYLDQHSLPGDTSDGVIGFVKWPSLYMVTDDLVVTPNSSISAIPLVTELRISPTDLEERVINIGQKEGLNILKASLISSSALTNGLSQFIKPIKVEKCN